jgi:hypothetical protein
MREATAWSAVLELVDGRVKVKTNLDHNKSFEMF